MAKASPIIRKRTSPPALLLGRLQRGIFGLVEVARVVLPLQVRSWTRFRRRFFVGMVCVGQSCPIGNCAIFRHVLHQPSGEPWQFAETRQHLLGNSDDEAGIEAARPSPHPRSAVNTSTTGLLYVANTTATTTGTVARIASNSTAGVNRRAILTPIRGESASNFDPSPEL